LLLLHLPLFWLLQLPLFWLLQPEPVFRELPPLQWELPPPPELVCPCGEPLAVEALADPTELRARQIIPAVAQAPTSAWNRRDPRPLISRLPVTAGQCEGIPALVPPC
jgi:hypothetical protein